VVYAVNCGGESHVDVFGIKYAKDSNRVGTSSDYGKQLLIARAPPPDQVKNYPVKDIGFRMIIINFFTGFISNRTLPFSNFWL